MKDYKKIVLINFEKFEKDFFTGLCGFFSEKYYGLFQIEFIYDKATDRIEFKNTEFIVDKAQLTKDLKALINQQA